MIAAYLFDMDGLLLDTERLARDSFVAAARDVGLELAAAEAFFLTLIGTSRRESDGLLRGFLPHHIRPDEVEARWTHHYTAHLAEDVPVKASVKETLQRLTGQGARMAVVTSTRGTLAREKLQRAALAEHFEFVLGGDEVSANKPHPAPYLEAAARMGVAAGHCAAFEDSDRGITSAMDAGCQAVQIPDLRPKGLQLPDLGQPVAETLDAAVTLVQSGYLARCG